MKHRKLRKGGFTALEVLIVLGLVSTTAFYQFGVLAQARREAAENIAWANLTAAQNYYDLLKSLALADDMMPDGKFVLTMQNNQISVTGQNTTEEETGYLQEKWSRIFNQPDSDRFQIKESVTYNQSDCVIIYDANGNGKADYELHNGEFFVVEEK